MLAAVIAAFLGPARVAARGDARGAARLIRVEAAGATRVVRVDAAAAPRTLRVRGAAGETVVRVERGAARIASSACPDKYCVRQGAIREPGETLICLPNRVVVTVEAGAEGEVDAVNR